jgi:putative chitinase
MKTAAQWLEILISCGVKAGTAVRWADSFSVEVLESSFSRGVAEMDDFLANILHESAMLETLEENLNYSAEGLINGFGRHRISIADALRYGRTAEHPADKPGIASCLYGGAWGLKNLGNKEPGDGFAFRGSGLIQCTGRANFEYLELITGLPVVNNPDMLRRPGPEAIAVAVAWWEGKVPDHVLGDIARTRRAVNGGDKGLAHVASLTDKLGDALA